MLVLKRMEFLLGSLSLSNPFLHLASLNQLLKRFSLPPVLDTAKQGHGFWRDKC